MEHMLLPLFEHLTDGICVSSEAGRILYLNPAAEKLLDITLDQVGECTLCDLLCAHLSDQNRSDCAAGCALLDAKARERAVTFDGRYGPKSAFAWREGRVERAEQWRNVRVRCLKSDTPWLGRAHPSKHLTIIEDASAMADLEAEREDWRNMIAHDLRNPLSNIFGALRSLQDEAAESGGAGPSAEIIDIGVQNCRRMIELLNLYLDVAKLDAGLMRPELKTVDLSAIAAECVQEQSPTAWNRRVEVSMRVPSGLAVRGDPEMLLRVVQNLLDNALKFTPAGGRVELSARADDPAFVELEVKDTGAGISPEEMPFLFDRYHQARARREGRTPGTGLGLAFCRQALRTMQGDIQADSETGKGSRFVIRLPRSAAQEPEKRLAHARADEGHRQAVEKQAAE